MRKGKFIASLAVALALVVGSFPAMAFADEALGDVDEPRSVSTSAPDDKGTGGQDGAGASTGAEDSSEPANASDDVQISKEADAALIEGSSFAISDFSRAQKGTNREIGGEYRGYSYLVGQEAGAFVQVVGADGYAVVYVPETLCQQLDFDVDDTADQDMLKTYLVALDAEHASGSTPLSKYDTWYFTSDTTYEVGAVRFSFDQQVNDNIYIFVIGTDGSDLTDSENPNYMKPSFADFAHMQTSDGVVIEGAPTGLAAVGEFFENLDWSPLWVTLRTTGIAIVIIFILGLLAAYFCLNISPKARNIFDTIFTIPMVLPPTVCGFILLWLCGSNTAFGRFFIDIGFPLIFSPAATVIAAVVVAFPLMYRNALGAFENLDANMLDAARTLGWSNRRIFVKLMLPLSWSSIAAGTVLAFARALGEFGATLFLAGNYVGITRTIPIAIYFEWMNANDEVAWFWTAVIIAFSFLVILFINLWSARTTKYRRRSEEN